MTIPGYVTLLTMKAAASQQTEIQWYTMPPSENARLVGQCNNNDSY